MAGQLQQSLPQAGTNASADMRFFSHLMSLQCAISAAIEN